MPKVEKSTAQKICYLNSMKTFVLIAFIILVFVALQNKSEQEAAWIRINQLGYLPNGTKVAVWCSKWDKGIGNWELVDAAGDKVVYKGIAGKNFGAYGPFKQTHRLNFSAFKKTGSYYLRSGATKSPTFKIADDVYKGTADFCLRYMRQQRSGFNPFLKDSCHTDDGYTLYGAAAGLPDSTHIDVSGGWHDASDYLQYSTTSANATYHLLMAYRDFPNVFTDEKLANGLDGKNNLPDVLDEAKWGLDWLLKMHPRDVWMFNQLGDDRDHISMRIPKMDSQYGKGFERPVYFITGEKQQRGKFLNNTTGTSSTAAKLASVFALAHSMIQRDSLFRNASERKSYYDKAFSAYKFAMRKQGVTQTASVKAPYIYAEDNWVDDLELASAAIHDMIIQSKAVDNGYYLVMGVSHAKNDKITSWLGADTANHYQWYPFINLGHYEVIKQLRTKKNGPGAGYYKEFVDGFWNNSDTIIGFYKEGINRVWNKAKQNAFYRGVPFIWCSNNLTVAFAMQCYWYRQLTNDDQFAELEQANIDWLFGCNPWGTSMVYGLPAWGDTPIDPHSAFTHLKNYPIDGGLVDGPVYSSIFNNLIGLKLYQPDEYEPFQSKLAVYHDDYGDYSTNEPTMDGTASLIYLLAAMEAQSKPKK
jgi:endoglucanase